MDKLIRKGFKKENIIPYGNTFLLANGLYGYRGTLEEYRKEEMVGLNVLGFYDKYMDKWRESINLPNPFFVYTKSNFESRSVLEKEPINHEVELDIYNGIFSRKTEYEDILIESKRIVSQDDKSILFMEYIVSAKKDTKVEIKYGLDDDIYEINGPHFIKKEIDIKNDTIRFIGTTNENKKIAISSTYSINGFDQKTYEKPFFIVSKTLKKNEKIILNAFSKIEKEEANFDHLINDNDYLAKEGFESLLKKHKKKFNQLWEMSDVVIKGDEEAQFEARYSIYHLLILGDENSKMSIPARGLSGETYKGAIFWDTEIFMLPFFINTNSKIARNLIEYRINTLNGARLKAKEFGYDGAFFAWESQEDGLERCSLYNVTDAITGKPVRTYFNEKQIHISADIVYAIMKYIKFTKDYTILKSGGYELMIEVSKFFMSYSTLEHDNKYHIKSVIGPDEYHEMVDDNAFTNYMTYYSVKSTIDYYDEYIDHSNSKIEKSKLESYKDNLYLPLPNEDGIIEQFKGYFDLEDTSLENVVSRKKVPNEYMGGKNGVVTPTRIIKQADVIALLALLDDDFSLKTKKDNYDFYFKYTEHGSSLSASMYSLIASEIGNSDYAYQMFRKSSSIDLGLNQKNFAGGIYIGGTHPASNGGTYLSLIYGFSGLKIINDELVFYPRLPKSIDEIDFKIEYNNKKYSITILKDSYIKEDYYG